MSTRSEIFAGFDFRKIRLDIKSKFGVIIPTKVIRYIMDLVIKRMERYYTAGKFHKEQQERISDYYDLD